MPAPSEPSSSASGNGRQNLFVEADPEYDVAASPRSNQPRSDTHAARRPRRGRGLVVAVDAPSAASAPSHGPDAARFTRRNTALDQLRAVAGHKLRQADARAGRLLRRLASRRYGALAVAAVLGGLLVALTWLGLAAHDASVARAAADQRLARAAVALNDDQTRIDSLSAELRQATLAASQPPASTPVTPASRVRGQAAGRKPGRHRRPDRRR